MNSYLSPSYSGSGIRFRCSMSAVPSMLLQFILTVTTSVLAPTLLQGTDTSAHRCAFWHGATMSVCREKVLAHVVHGQRGRPLSPVTASEADGEWALLVVGVVLAVRAVSARGNAAAAAAAVGRPESIRSGRVRRVVIDVRETGLGDATTSLQRTVACEASSGSRGSAAQDRRVVRGLSTQRGKYCGIVAATMGRSDGSAIFGQVGIGVDVTSRVDTIAV